MFAILSLLVVIFLSILITRIATVSLTHTGLSREVARFQARSAFTGAGFTTDESEMVTRHPVRRRIVLLLMLLGNAGIVTAVSSLMLSFINRDDGSGLGVKVLALVAGLAVLWWLAQSRWVDRYASMVIDWALNRFTDMEVRDYASLLRLHGEYRLAELKIEKNDWLEGKSLKEAGLRKEGVNILGIRRPDGRYCGVPRGDTQIRQGDVMILYGRGDALEELDERHEGSEGDRRHGEAVREQEEEERREADEEREREDG